MLMTVNDSYDLYAAKASLEGSVSKLLLMFVCVCVSAVGEWLTVTSALDTNIKVRSNKALTESVICSITSSESKSSDAYPSTTLRGLIQRPRYWSHKSQETCLTEQNIPQHVGLDCSSPEDEFKSYQFIHVRGNLSSVRGAALAM